MTMNIVQSPVADRALDAATLCEAFQITAATCPQRVALRAPGDAVVVTWEQYAERVRRTAAGLAALGVRRGDTVALMLSNRPEFHIADLAVAMIGATPYSVYTTYPAEEIEYLVNDAAIACSICARCSSGAAARIASSPALSFSQIRGTAKNQVGCTRGR